MSKFFLTPKRDSFGCYLKSIGQHSVLSKEEEIALAKHVKRMTELKDLRESKESLEETVDALECTKADYHRLIKKGEWAKEKMIVHNLRLVVCIAKRYNNRGVDLEDLVQEGNIGLNRAVEKFNPELGYKFSTYACVPTTTQILTKRGWLNWNEVREGDETLGYDPRTATTQWTPIKGVTDYADAPLLRIGDGKWFTQCTANHKWLMERQYVTTLEPIESWPPEGKVTRNTPDVKLIIAAPYRQGTKHLPTVEATILGWFYAAGNVNHDKKGRLSSYTIRQAGVEKINTLRGFLKKAGLYLSEDSPLTDFSTKFYLKVEPFTKLLEKLELDRKELFEVVTELGEDTRNEFNEGWKHAALQDTRNHVNDRTKIEGAFDAFQLSMYLDGVQGITRRQNKKKADSIHWRSAALSARRCVVTKEGTTAHVWCPTTPLGTWTAKDANNNIFLTGNTWWIRQSIARAVATQSRPIRLPVHIYDLLNKIKRSGRELSQQLKRQATLPEIAEHLGITTERVHSLTVYSKGVLSLDLENLDTDCSNYFTQFSELESLAQDHQVEKEEYLHLIALLNQLTKLEQTIIIMRYGMNSDRQMTYKSIAEHLKISTQKVRNNASRAMKKLQALADTPVEEILKQLQSSLNPEEIEELRQLEVSNRG